MSQRLKMTEKVSLNIASEASYVYSIEAYLAHVISQCVQFVIVLSRDRNLGRVDELI